MPRRNGPGEDDLIRRIRRLFPKPGREVRVPIGDDAALLRLPPRTDLVLTTDQMVEGIHFRRLTHPPELVGARALTVNLSDVASLGAVPRWFLLSLLIPRDLPPEYLHGTLRGMATEARRRRVALVGGNLTRAAAFGLDVTLVGVLPPGRSPLLRSGGRPGDALYVSGTLGASALGLELLEAGWRWSRGRARPPSAVFRDRSAVSRALRAHLTPSPPYHLAALLSRHRLASAAIDISDGLSTDLLRLCRASRVGARLERGQLPLDPAVVRLRGSERALELALNGGEEYQLLFAVPVSREGRLARLASRHRITRVGILTAARTGQVLADANGSRWQLPPGGHDHLGSPAR